MTVGNENRIEGHRHSRSWATDQRLFFVLEFSTPFSEYQLKAWGKDPIAFSKGIFLFPQTTEDIEVRVALSSTDLDGARRNFESEVNAFDFEELVENNQTIWRKELDKIHASFNNEVDQIKFYTALYHNMIAPNLYSDVDGRYRGMDQDIYSGTEHPHYTVFSLWDTYRATHPLYTIIDQKRTSEFIGTMLRKYDHGGILPIWDLAACYTGCMIGYHGVSVIADAYIKGIRGYDEQKALQAIVHSATQDHLGLKDYKSKGFIAAENESESVSKTLEYAYDDWCIAQMANAIGDETLFQQFSKRSLNYRNLFEPKSRFFQARRFNYWNDSFNPFEVNNDFTEANAWHYAFSAVHDMTGLIALHGGKDELEKALDNLFTAKSETTGRDQADITGLIGQYAHGNEPSHHIAYLYNYVGKPWKTQERVSEILATQYRNDPDGVSGNEDCGQMSAWYVLSAMGFYSVLPGSDYYVIGSPLIKEATIDIENGNHFRITTNNNTPANAFIQSVTLNGQPYTKSFLLHADIMKGGHLHFEMGGGPNKSWASGEEVMPPSYVDDKMFISPPYLTSGQLSFSDSMIITMASLNPSDKKYYAIDNGDFQDYDDQGILVKQSCQLCVFSKNESLVSDTLCTNFIKFDNNKSITLMSTFANMYDAGGEKALIDGLRGGEDFRTGGWQGFEGQHLECVIDLGEIQFFETVSCGFLQDENSWIFFPSEVEFFISEDGEAYETMGQISSKVSPRDKGAYIEDFIIESEGWQGRYIRMKATSLIDCPDWHKGAVYDGKAWLFADEIIIK
jgi:predicted alpha-1,2-mannosidase